ncbi:archaeosine tRNA-ribosyltransferase [Desulfocucumis palustris]|uniref:Archaeosine tRNA-ribosyltransferase n=1 Tax=Desulfocucumis palustris TaxID=1898651 RepID=A0A2L2XDE5_9FIRM|nr:tRNA-guanine transglycosylase DpdA [Desulfocucumis palustris]GBF31841.1 archaeosine tRNA-ribosyltransferase [Desulfocucumis palustris]
MSQTKTAVVSIANEKIVNGEQKGLSPEYQTERSECRSEDNKESRLKGKNEFDFWIPDKEVAKNYGLPVKYFIPEWDDRVDPDYNFIADEPVMGRDPYTHDLYAHEIYGMSNYDGVLISKVTIEESQTKREKVSSMSVHDFIRFSDGPIMGDCGAFSYIKQPEPPYQTVEILDYYEKMGFDYGVSIDHLIVGDIALDPDERKRRFNITRDNANEFYSLWNKGGYKFKPIGVAQGWDPQSFCESVACLVDMGYERIALGSLARAPSKVIIEILKEVREVIPDYLKVHLFGVARLDLLPAFRRLGMTSFDSASYLRSAWLNSNGKNYFTLDGSHYSAIRVPPTDGRTVKKMVEQGRGSMELFKILEGEALKALRRYDKGLAALDETLEKVLAYDRLIGGDRGRHAEMYRRTLEEQPWKSCGCKICEDVGIEVIIFRRNNRNRRRGFHNTYVFYKLFQEICK